MGFSTARWLSAQLLEDTLKYHCGRAHQLAVDVVLPGELCPVGKMKSGELPSLGPGRTVQALWLRHTSKICA